MSPLAAKILIVGVPLLISLSWFVFWVLRLTRAARRLKTASGVKKKDSEAGPRA